MKKRMMVFGLVLALLAIPQAQTLAEKEEEYRHVAEKTIEVKSNRLNVRTGPGTNYPVIQAVAKGQKLQVLGAIGQWYLVRLSDGAVGMLSGKHTIVTELEPDVLQTDQPQGDDEATAHEGDDSEAGQMFRLINKERESNSLPLLAWDEELNKIAEIKAQDMVDNEYFGHFSPSYGTPFTMLKQLGIMYKSASENIAGSKSVEDAHNELMESPAHRSNILSSRYDKVGIGTADSPEYGKIIVQIFIEEAGPM